MGEVIYKEYRIWDKIIAVLKYDLTFLCGHPNAKLISVVYVEV